jgi:DedD protein
VDEGLKRRLIGATVLVSLAVIFLPMLLEDKPVVDTTLDESNIPPRPEGNFSSRVLPLESESLSTLPEPDSSEQVADSQVEAVAQQEPPGLFEPEVGQKEPTPVETARETPAVPEDTPKEARSEPVKPAEISTAPKLAEGVPAWVVQVGSFSKRDNADRVSNELKEKSFQAFVEEKEVKGKTYYRVLVGPETDRAEAGKLWEKVKPALEKWKLVSRLRSYP